jgi:hypothetical protein
LYFNISEAEKRVLNCALMDILSLFCKPNLK